MRPQYNIDLRGDYFVECIPKHHRDPFPHSQLIMGKYLEGQGDLVCRVITPRSRMTYQVTLSPQVSCQAARVARTTKAQRLTGKTRAISPGEGETHIAQKGQWMLQGFQGLGASSRLASGLKV